MNNFFNKYNSNNRRIFFLVMFMFVGFSGFSQSETVNGTDLNVTKEVFNVVTDELPVKASSTVNMNSNSNFILWFMGTKVGPAKTISIEGMYTKNQIISTGAVPNHLLMKTLLKKTINLKFC